ncbi:hypothetical protein TL16_g07851 [Triparma laevis f. inornata]|uniref:Heme-binding protein 2 n=2 Tax=Triparma laevis TaxID=1534972 RepID=A0A9W7F850_9STRA|nr:hypothetical protein TL16_g07851 [Triparma laevis f. inornata]GMI06880.1 hypothetical protein TrLO_g15395 [Triparma laevis f. longispina]
MKLLLASLALTAASASNPFTAPWFCHDLDCPSFTTKQTTDNDVEIRSYDSLQWASTVVETDSAEDAGDIAFHRLFDYISGANDASQKIDMTAPVLNYIHPGAGPNCNSTFTVSFFVPWMYQTEKGPPAPTSSDVFIEEKKLGEFAVSSFGGFADDNDMVQQAVALTDKVDESKEVEFNDDANAGNYYFVAYDSPYTLMNRHNEDWIGVEDL